jgi:CHAD domain-containing protein
VSDARGRDDTVPEWSSAHVVRQFLGAEVGNILRNNPIAREGSDPEGVHQLRVSSRRLRAELTILRPVFEEKPLHEMLVELRWFAKTLAGQRELDVRVALVRHLRSDLPAWLFESLLEGLERRRLREDARVRQILDSGRYRRLISALAEAVVAPPLNARATARGADVLEAGLCEALSALIAKVDEWGRQPTYEQLHEIRILTKKARYCAALSSTMFGLQARNVAASLEQVQTILGELHDRVLFLHYLNEEVDKIAAEQPSVNLKRPRVRLQRRLNREIRRLNSQWRGPYSDARRHGAAFCRSLLRRAPEMRGGERL